MKSMNTIRGRFDTKTGARSLRQVYYDYSHVLAVRLDPEPDREIFICDVQIGKNSQVCNAKAFEASILSRLSTFCCDSLLFGMDITFSFYGDYAGTCEIDVGKGKRSDKNFRLILPSGRSQINGRVMELVTTKELHEAIKADEVKLFVSSAPSVPEWQEKPRLNTVSIGVVDEKLLLTTPIDITVFDTISFSFESESEHHFRQTDVIALLEPSDT